MASELTYTIHGIHGIQGYQPPTMPHFTQEITKGLFTTALYLAMALFQGVGGGLHCGGWHFLPLTPWKINMEPTNHPFRKENDLPNLHDYVPC